ncbi:MAG TPA: twin-arginine translocase subunit TatC [Anaerolineales bacterium]|nr:twin-arginine translocase subunit TatC [Anaerolineales bacterium]
MRTLFRLLWRALIFPFRLVGATYRELRKLLMDEPEDSPLVDSIQKAVENPSDILAHLNALRKHIFRAIGVLLLTSLVSLIFAAQIIDKLAEPVGGISKLIAIDPTEPLGVVMRVALLTGFTLSFPYIALELWLFAAPGLSRDARLFGLAAIPIGTLFFLGGMAFAYFVMLPTALPFLINFMGFTTQIRPSSYIKFITGIMFWIGVAFEFPLVIYVLARVGLVRGKVLADQWRLAIVLMAVLSAAITPTVDPVNMSLVMGPMIGLYFLSIGLAYLAERARIRRRVQTA